MLILSVKTSFIPYFTKTHLIYVFEMRVRKVLIFLFFTSDSGVIERDDVNI